MVQANELRIGNYISDIHTESDFWQVKMIQNRFCYYGMFSEKYENLKGILLTEEWLFKFGFESNLYQDRYKNGVINIECNKLRGYTELWIDRLPHIKYVHQLQNLYFALTSQELQIK